MKLNQTKLNQTKLNQTKLNQTNKLFRMQTQPKMNLPIELSRQIQDFIRPKKCIDPACFNLTLNDLCDKCTKYNECDNCGKPHYWCYCEY